MSREREWVEVDPARLASGEWDRENSKLVGEGDIYASSSQDRIGTGRPLRKAFRFRNADWVCTGMIHHRSASRAEAYRVVHESVFEDEATTYCNKTRDCEAARNDPKGFYHGMRVTSRGQPCVLCGPPVEFVPGESVQSELFRAPGSSRER
ncbi:MAG: hypothetical protein RLN60_03500 [Phycisphaerales bacterium]